MNTTEALQMIATLQMLVDSVDRVAAALGDIQETLDSLIEHEDGNYHLRVANAEITPRSPAEKALAKQQWNEYLKQHGVKDG